MFEISKTFLPSSMAFLIEYGIIALNFIFVSFLDDPILMSGCGLGNATVNLIVASFCAGLCGGIDTLVSQAYGRKDYYLCGVYLNTARIVTVIANIIQTVVLLNIKSIFLIVGQPPESADIASYYIISVLPGLFMNMQFECLRRFLLVQGIYNPIMYILTSTVLLHIIQLYFFVLVFNYKIGGIAVATTTTYSLNFLLLTGYVHFKKDLIKRESWHLFDINCILKIPRYLGYAIPACLMCTIEVWAFEILIVFSGYLGLKQLAALTIMLSINTIIFMFALGISFACTSLVGNNLGANKPNKAMIYSRSALAFCFAFFVPIIVLLIIFMRKLACFYTSDEEVVEMILSCGVVWVLGIIGDMTNGVSSGMIRAMGYQSIATVIGVISFWVIMVPTSFIFGIILGYGNKGVWLGVPVGASIQMCSYFYIFFNAPWRKIAEKASTHDHQKIENEIPLENFVQNNHNTEE